MAKKGKKGSKPLHQVRRTHITRIKTREAQRPLVKAKKERVKPSRIDINFHSSWIVGLSYNIDTKRATMVLNRRSYDIYSM